MSNTELKGKKLHRTERRIAIIQGAAAAFVQYGYEATTLDDVTKSAGVSRALLYRHFDTKQDVYWAVLDNFTSTMRTQIDTKQERWANLTLENLVKAAQIDPNGFRLFFRHAPREPDFQSYYDDIATKRLNFIEERLKPTIKNRKQRRFIAELMQELVIGTLLIWVDNGSPNPKQMPKLLSDILDSVINN